MPGPLKGGKTPARDRNDLAKRIGSELRRLRRSMRLSMKQLAKETGLSAPLFSRIENGLVMPSIPTLQRVSDALKVDIEAFFRKGGERGYVITHPGGRTIQRSKRGPFEIELLAEGMGNPFMDPFIAPLAAKDRENEVAFSTHEGQEFCYVLEGKVELLLGDRKYILKKGDAAYWNGSVPHKGLSLSKRQAKTLNVQLIPGRRVSQADDPVPLPVVVATEKRKWKKKTRKTAPAR